MTMTGPRYTKNRTRCRSYPVSKFFDPTTGAFCRLDNTPWHLKNVEGKPGYFLQMDMTMQELPEAAFKATAARSKTYDFSNVQKQIDSFMKEVKNESSQS
jgi:hypothetical protein|tara:strand:+ start:392 stop:691 length:300 start_codon:yes stop_codon:yes gene_type:complete